MPKIQINRVANANVYVEGVNLLGRANKVTLPHKKDMMEDHHGLGMRGKLSIPAGGFELTEATFEWASFYADVLRSVQRAGQAIALQLRASVEEYGSAGLIGETPLVVSMNGLFTDIDFGSFEQHKPITQPMTFTPYYLQIVADGEELLEVDLFNNIYKEAGVDTLSRFRSIIGG